MTAPSGNGFRPGVYVFTDVEIIDFAAPYGGSAYELYREDLERATTPRAASVGARG